MLAYVGAVLADVGAMLDPGRPMLGPSWPLLGLWCGRGPMLGTGGPATLAPCNLACFGATFAMLSQDNIFDKIFDKNNRFARRERHVRLHLPLSEQCWAPAGAKLAWLVAMLGPFWLMLGPMLPYVGPHWSHVV